MRAFACAALLRAAEEPENEGCDGAEDGSLAQALASALHLGQETSEAAAQFLTWRIPRLTCNPAKRLVFPLGLLVLATCLRDGRVEEPVLGEAAEWFLDEEATLRRDYGPFVPGGEGAFLIASLFSVQQGLWQLHGAELIRQAQAVGRDDVRQTLEFVGGLVLDPW
jgi:hypothetical protein